LAEGKRDCSSEVNSPEEQGSAGVKVLNQQQKTRGKREKLFRLVEQSVCWSGG
jgi:hypothetical protein